MLKKLTSMDQLQAQNEDLSQKIEEMNEDLESNQKACDYYRNDMIPTIKEQLEKMNTEMQEVKRENINLKNSN